MLIGHGGDDQLDAGAGNDLIWGGKGADILTGGAGKDAFLFTKTEDSNAANGIDRIVDFEPGIDKINLSGIDAKTSTPADDAFSFVAAQSGVQANKVTWKQFDVSGSANDYTLVQADVNGDGTADFEIRLTGLKALTASDFVL